MLTQNECLMLLQIRNPPIVFGGPSLRLVYDRYQQTFDFRPPVRRGDLHALLKQHSTCPGCVLLTDGVFGSNMSVSPVECLDLIHSGWLVLGSSSMGALRAADCANAGMQGVGNIFFGFRSGYYHSDADVAVLYNADDHSELSISFAHADHLARILAHKHPLSGPARRRLLQDLRVVPWFERFPHVVAELFATHFSCPELLSQVPILLSDVNHNPKNQDALMACDLLAKFYLRKYINR